MDEPHTPDSGHLAHDFARFRKQRLETQRFERAKAEAKRKREEANPDGAPESSEDVMFFGTSSNERRLLSSTNKFKRESPEAPKARARRRKRPPPLPTRDRDRGPRTTPPRGTGIGNRGRPRRAG